MSAVIWTILIVPLVVLDVLATLHRTGSLQTLTSQIRLGEKLTKPFGYLAVTAGCVVLFAHLVLGVG